MRIAHFLLGRCNPESSNGVDKTIFYLSRAQGALGHTVVVFSITGKSPIPIPGVEVRTYRPLRFPFKFLDAHLGGLLKGRSPINFPPRLLRELWEWKADIIHLHSVHIPQNVILGVLSRHHDLPYVVTVHGGLFPTTLQRRRIRKWLFGIILERKYFESSAFMHAIGDSEKQALSDYGYSGDTIVAPNGFDIETIPRCINKQLLAQRFPEVRGKRVLMFLGRLDPEHKGLDMLVQGFAKAPANNVILILVGPDWRGGQRRLESLIHGMGVGSRVIFTGPVYGQEKFDFLAGADVFVHTSRWEADVPFSVLEAAAVGLPCFVTRPADPAGMLSTYQAGIAIDATLESIAQGLSQVTRASHEELKAMGANARHMVETEFGWERIARTLTDAYSRYTTLA